MYDIVGVGHNCLDRLCIVENYPDEDSSTHITSIEVQGGGAAATALCAASRLGKKTALIGPIGTDGVSQDIIRMLDADGVDTSKLIRDPAAAGLQSFVMINPANGSRTKFPQRDRLPDIVWTDELKNMIGNSRMLHLDGTNYNNAAAAALIAKERGVTVSLDGCSMQQDNAKNRLLASMADILIMNAKYPLRVSGRDSYEAALREISYWGPSVVMCTLGSKGCMAVIDGQINFFNAFPVKAIDTTGAGDVFHGAFLCGFLDGMNIYDNIRFAAGAAALKCTKTGGRAGIPSKKEALQFINSFKDIEGV